MDVGAWFVRGVSQVNAGFAVKLCQYFVVGDVFEKACSPAFSAASLGSQ